MSSAPVFIVGCGRSGTTALGTTLGAHPDVTYLNEPRQLWSLDPRTDVWSRAAGSVGRLALDENDADEHRGQLRNAFAAATEPGTVLIEKTPINSFRIGYIRRVWPNARFLHLLRNGLEVADSIERWVASGKVWFGAGDAKWHLLQREAERAGIGELADICGDDPRLRGLLEWRLAVTRVQSHLGPDDLEIRYRTLVTDPGRTIGSVVSWIGLDDPGIPVHISRRPHPAPRLAGRARRIAGPLLGRLGYA